MYNVDISVVVPIYNVEKYVVRCLESLINQSYKDIEILCVDDCSTDHSLELVETIAKTESRIKVLKNKENRGLLYTRKRGVIQASGRYIMFLDSDDFYSEDACKVALETIEREQTDIVQFGLNVINAGNAPQYECDSFENFVKPYNGKIANGMVLRDCFFEEKYNYNLVNKIYNASLCKKAFDYIKDDYYLMAEDMLAYFCISFFAKSYFGITQLLYNYNFGIGVSRPGQLDLDGFEKRCGGAVVVKAIYNFLNEQCCYIDYEAIYLKIERRILSDNFAAWYYRLPKEYREEGYNIFENYWGKDKVMLSLLYDIENKQRDISNKEKQIKELVESTTWKVGRILTLIPRTIKECVLKRIK